MDGSETCICVPSEGSVEFKFIPLKNRGILRLNNVFSVFQQIIDFYKSIEEYDEVCCIGFSVLGTILATECILAGKEIMFYVRGDAVAFNDIEYTENRRTRIAYEAVRLFQKYNFWLFVKAKAVLVCGEQLRKRFCGLNKNTFSVNPLLPEYYLESETPRIPKPFSPCFKILYVGWLLKRKGVYVLLEAVRLLNKNVRNWELVIIGEGVERAGLERWVEENNLNGNVYLEGSVKNDELIRVYDQADVLVLPSYTEGTPRVIAEAFSRGLPVIATDVGSVSCMVQNGWNGLLTGPGKVIEICELLKYLIKNPEKREFISSRAMESCKKYMIKDQAELVKNKLCQIEALDQ